MSVQTILFVCLGNICRSPLVESVARKRLAEAGLKIKVASCGTGGWHAGEQADPRMRAAAAGAGYDLGPHRARQLSLEDFERYDLLLAMDSDNMREMRRMVGEEVARRTCLFLEWARMAPPHEFPDPYFGELTGFVQSIVLAEQGVRGLIGRLRDGG
ncbi:phosphotyrosine protein phosphatase [Dyella mobilis]|uniref:protein-tyrosine-phosphatase n=1 Tax=Dyella mobilis TaxID=1849582 RepID=A0ABS2KJU2_9GAMM|nr:low molecular weight phosphotyrosine protein phosphatase [Dyella mobilis]GLQ98749.1 phosphotyrosine protein phosphatase [Dyella mobilis]